MSKIDQHELDDDDKARITEAFYNAIVKKLEKLHALNGIITCGFAGEQHKSWNIHFSSVGSDFDIVDFEYDEDGTGMDFDL